MNRICSGLIILWCVLTLSCASGCSSNQAPLEPIREAFVSRAQTVSGFEIGPIEAFDTFYYFSIRVSFQEDDAVREEDILWFEAHVYYFPDEKEAQTVYERHQNSTGGDRCAKRERFLLSWLNDDPFEDFYQDVFFSLFDGES